MKIKKIKISAGSATFGLLDPDPQKYALKMMLLKRKSKLFTNNLD